MPVKEAEILPDLCRMLGSGVCPTGVGTQNDHASKEFHVIITIIIKEKKKKRKCEDLG
jgi:hypothetical protein